MKAQAVNLAVVGHTNTGKTSLLRTLTRDARFGEVSDRPATTRDVTAIDLLLDEQPCIRLFDTPGVEDPLGLLELIESGSARFDDPVAGIEHFLEGDHGGGRFEQEAKVLRQLRRSDAALYVIDTREPPLKRHNEELRLLAQCGRPLMPLLNFVADPTSRSSDWRERLARLGLHVLADFDTVVFDHAAEQALFEKLAVLLEARAADIRGFARERDRQRAELLEAACRTVAEMLVDVAAYRLVGRADEALEPQLELLRAQVGRGEQRCVDGLLSLFEFELGSWAPPQLPLEGGRWALDPFDPEALRVLGLRTGSAMTAGAAAGVSVDAMLGGASLGAGALLGAGAGTAWSFYQSFGKPYLDRWRGLRTLNVEVPTLALLAARQLGLLRALARRGHASEHEVMPEGKGGWPSEALRKAVLRARAHPQWSALEHSHPEPRPQAALAPILGELRRLLRAPAAPEGRSP